MAMASKNQVLCYDATGRMVEAITGMITLASARDMLQRYPHVRANRHGMELRWGTEVL